MIPYDELVVALATWRAKQGLPVAHGQKQGSAPTATPAPATAKPGSGPQKGPPTAPPRSAPQPVDAYDVDDAALLDETMDQDNLGAAFDAVTTHGDEATAIGGAPHRDSFGGPTATGDMTIDEQLAGRGKSKGKKSPGW